MELIRHHGLPADVWVAVRKAEAASDRPSHIPVNTQEISEENQPEERKWRKISRDRRRSRRQLLRTGGRQLIADIVADKLGAAELDIEVDENQKPHACCDGTPVQISISHTDSLICAAASTRRILGVDLESSRRAVHPRLRERILHPLEQKAVDSISMLQLWTLKEAALKWSGRGLRTAMKRVRVVASEGDLFQILMPEGDQLDLCSFQYRNHWISIAFESETSWRETPDSEASESVAEENPESL